MKFPLGFLRGCGGSPTAPPEKDVENELPPPSYNSLYPPQIPHRNINGLKGNWHLNINNFKEDLIMLNKNQKLLTPDMIKTILGAKTPRVILDICCRHLLRNVGQIFNYSACFIKLNRYDEWRQTLLTTDKNGYITRPNNYEKDEWYELLMWENYLCPRSIKYNYYHFAYNYSEAFIQGISPHISTYFEEICKDEDEYAKTLKFACWGGNLELIKYFQQRLSGIGNQNQTLTEEFYYKINTLYPVNSIFSNKLMKYNLDKVKKIFYVASQSGNDHLIQYLLELIKKEGNDYNIQDIYPSILNGLCYGGFTELIDKYLNEANLNKISFEELYISCLKGGNLETLSKINYSPPDTKKEFYGNIIKNAGHVDVYQNYVSQ